MSEDREISPPEAESGELSMEDAVAALSGVDAADGGDDGGEGQADKATEKPRDASGRFAKRESEAGDGGSEMATDQPEDGETIEGDVVLDGLDLAGDDGAELGEAETFTVRANGTDLEVTLDELKSGYSREADYRRKTQALAEERRELQAEREQLQATLQQQQQNVGSYAELVQQIGPEPQMPTLDQFDGDEYAFMQAFARHQSDKARWDQAKGQYDQQLAQQAQQAQAQQQAYLAEQQQALVEKWPAMGDTAKAPQIKAALGSFLSDRYGFTPEELATLADHRTVLMIRDAYAYHNARKGREKAAEAVKAKPRITRPGARRDTSDEYAERRDALLRKRPGGELTFEEASSLYTGEV